MNASKKCVHVRVTKHGAMAFYFHQWRGKKLCNVYFLQVLCTYSRLCPDRVQRIKQEGERILFILEHQVFLGNRNGVKGKKRNVKRFLRSYFPLHFTTHSTFHHFLLKKDVKTDLARPGNEPVSCCKSNVS